MVHQNLYWLHIRGEVLKEVTECDIFQRKKWTIKQHSIIPDKLAEEIP